MGFPPPPQRRSPLPTPPQPHCGAEGGARTRRAVRIPAANRRPAGRRGWPITALRRPAEAIKGGAAARWRRAWPAVRERRKMAEGDNNSVYQLVRAGGAGRGLAAARACWGRRRSQARPALLCPTHSGCWRGPLGPALCDAVWLRGFGAGSARSRAWGGCRGCRPGARERRLRCCSRAGAFSSVWRYLICGGYPDCVCLSVCVCLCACLSVSVCLSVRACLFVCVQPPAAGPNAAALRESGRR